MRSFEIFVEPETTAPFASPAPADGARAPEAGPTPSQRSRANEVLDLFVHGANVTARIPERHASFILRDLAWALGDLVRTPRGKRFVRFYDDAWELCVERIGAQATLSIYRGGSEPTVLTYDRVVVFQEMLDSIDEALASRLARRDRGALSAELDGARRALSEARTNAPSHEDVVEPAHEPVTVDLDRDAPISFAAEFPMRAGAQVDDLEARVERADLHALLVRGAMRAEIRGRSVDLGDGFPFLFGERLLDLARRALEAWERGQPFFARLDAGGVMVGLRVAAGDAAPAALTMSPASTGRRDGAVSTFPELSLFDVVEASLGFGRAFVRAVLRRDRSQGANLKLGGFRRELRALGDALREVRRQDAHVNPSPESYRAYVEQRRAPKDEPAESLASTRLRYAQRWHALVPGIDLRATFLCGDRIVIGAASDTYCLDRSSGEVVWQKRTPRGVSVVTPSGIARLLPDGAVMLHDLDTGEVGLRTWIAPRLSGPPSGAVVAAAGLPRLLVVTEGERHLVALDLTSGESRWRYAWGKGGALRIKRVGKLLYVASGDSALTAVDVQTGGVVWRVRDRLRFRTLPTVDHEALFAVAGGAASAAQLHAVDPYSGHVAWTGRVPSSPCTVEGAPLATTSTVTLAIRDRRGLCLVGFDRASGDVRYQTAPLAPIGTSWLVVDDLLVGNTPHGEVLGVDASTGEVRYRVTLGSSAECDVPRRLEPVLRSGALFVPHVEVHVLRPTDGARLGTIGPCDAIPDLLRVDERCDVYVAEESGHMACFAAGPRLSLVR